MSKWPMVPLGEVAEWGSGGTPPRKNLKCFGPGTPWLSIADLNDGEVSTSKESLTETGLASSSAKLVPPGTVLVAMYGSIGKLGVAATELCTSQAIAFAKPKPGLITTAFLFYALRALRPRLVSMGRGGTQSNIGQGDLKRIEVPLPPIDEQRRIAAILDCAGTQLQSCRTAASLLQPLSQAVFHEMFSKNVYEPTLLGDLISEHQLGLDRKSSDLSQLGRLPYLKMDSITSTGGLDLSKANRADCSVEEEEKYSLREGDLIFNTRNARDLVGKSTVYRGPKSLFNNNILRLRFVDSVRPDFIHHFLWSREGRRQLDARKSGTTSVWAIYLKSLKTIQVPLPDLETQTEFALRLKTIEKRAQHCRRYESSLEELVGSLQSRAFRGEL